MQYLLEIKDERKKDFLLELLANFDFVRVRPNPVDDQPHLVNPEPVAENTERAEEEEEDFFAASGMLSHWTISTKDLKEKAWGIKTK